MIEKSRFSLFSIQGGSSSWKRTLLILSNLPPEVKKQTEELGNHYYNLMAKKYLRHDEQDEPGFNVDKFSNTHGLLKFSFVRHPFDRFVRVV